MSAFSQGINVLIVLTAKETSSSELMDPAIKIFCFLKLVFQNLCVFNDWMKIIKGIIVHLNI